MKQAGRSMLLEVKSVKLVFGKIVRFRIWERLPSDD